METNAHTEKNIYMPETGTVLVGEDIQQLYENRREVLRQVVTHFMSENNIGAQSDNDLKKIVDLCARALISADIYNVENFEVILETLKPLMGDEKALRGKVDELVEQMHEYKSAIVGVCRNGLLLRKHNNPEYPDLLSDGRFYLRIKSIPPLEQKINKFVGNMNAVMPDKKWLELFVDYSQENPVFELKDKDENKRKLGKFMHVITSDLQKLVDEMQKSEWTDAIKEAFLQTVRAHSEMVIRPEKEEKNKSGEGETSTKMPKSDKRNRHIIKEFNEAHGTDVRLTETAFYMLKSVLKNVTDSKEICAALQQAICYVDDLKEELSYQQTRSYSGGLTDKEPVDLLIFSKMATDIACMSAYTDLGRYSCMAPTEEQFPKIADDIGCGTIIVYGVNSQNPHKRLSRILLKQRKGNNGNDMIYNIGRVHGRKDSKFVQIVSDFVRENFDHPGSSTTFTLLPQLYQDGDAEHVYRCSSLAEVCAGRNIKMVEKDGEMFVYGRLHTSDFTPNMNIDFDHLYVFETVIDGPMPPKMPYSYKVLIDERVPLAGKIDLSRCKSLEVDQEFNLEPVDEIVLGVSVNTSGKSHLVLKEKITYQTQDKQKMRKIPNHKEYAVKPRKSRYSSRGR